MPHLTAVRMDKKSHNAGLYPTKKSSLWPGITSSKDIALRYAQLMHSNCTSLRYVGIGRWVWQIITKYGPDLATEPAVEFRELDHDEKSSIELFALEHFASQSGLPGTEREIEALSEEQTEHMERILEEVNEAYNNGTLPRWLYE